MRVSETVMGEDGVRKTKGEIVIGSIRKETPISSKKTSKK